MSAATDVPDRSLRDGYLIAAVGKGGSKWHLLPRTPDAKENDQGHGIALCGYSPRSTYSRHMTARAGWYRANPETTRLRTIPWCEKCQAARPEFDAALAAAAAPAPNKEANRG